MGFLQGIYLGRGVWSPSGALLEQIDVIDGPAWKVLVDILPGLGIVIRHGLAPGAEDRAEQQEVQEVVARLDGPDFEAVSGK